MTSDPEEAARVFDQALAPAPDRISAWTGLSGARLGLGDRAGALAAADRALALARRRGADRLTIEIERIRRRILG